MLTPSLKEVMDAYASAEREFRENVHLDRDDEKTDALWNVKEAAELAVIRHPCLTIEDVREKARLAIQDENVFDSISNCTFNGEHELYIFLRSILGDAEEEINEDAARREVAR